MEPGTLARQKLEQESSFRRGHYLRHELVALRTTIESSLVLSQPRCLSLVAQRQNLMLLPSSVT
jgi:hypothetical protein